MANKSYTVRVSDSAPDVASERAAEWLDAQLASNTPLAADPGSGNKTLRTPSANSKHFGFSLFRCMKAWTLLHLMVGWYSASSPALPNSNAS